MEGAGATYLKFPRLGETLRVDSIERHPTADAAALFCNDHARMVGRTGHPDLAFWDGVGNWSLGENFMSYGFPAESSGPDGGPAGSTPIPRLFMGYFQRFFVWESPAGFRYLAGELSMAAPGGLSGGPLFRPGAQQMILGLVTANHESYAITDSVETVDDNGEAFPPGVSKGDQLRGGPNDFWNRRLGTCGDARADGSGLGASAELMSCPP
jgi:hypothetical protein